MHSSCEGKINKEESKMKWLRIKVVSLLVAVVLLLGIFTFVPGVSAKVKDNDAGRDDWDINVYDDIEIVSGTIGDPEVPYYEEHKEWDEKGDFVGIRFSQDSWFVIIHGNEENHNTIKMMSVQLRYLGGATVELTDYDVVVEEVGIPVASVFIQSLEILLEFEDVGYRERNMFFEETGEPVGADNHLFDLEFRGEEIDDLDVTKCEPVHKAIHLNTTWERSEIVEIENKDDFQIKANDREWEFTLTATDLSYFDEDAHVWDKDFEPDGTNATELDKIEFSFHVGAEANQVNIKNIPWYDIEVSGTDEDTIKVESSEKQEAPRDFKGTAITGNFKYDHYLEGWDYSDPESDSKHLLLETVSAFGTFIPNIVADWIDIEQMNDNLTRSETAVYNTPWGEEEVTVDMDIPEKTTLVQKEQIQFKDNWRQVGEVSWISDVEVDGKDDNMYCQIHAKQKFTNERTEKEDGYFSGMLILSGYVYPGGDVIFHDPAYSANALLIDIPILIDLSLMDTGYLVCGVLIGIMAVMIATVIAVVRLVKRKQK
jgi:hypothetical protein